MWERHQDWLTAQRRCPFLDLVRPATPNFSETEGLRSLWEHLSPMDTLGEP